LQHQVKPKNNINLSAEWRLIETSSFENTEIFFKMLQAKQTDSNEVLEKK